MKQLFIVSVDEDATASQRDAFTTFLLGEKCGFWHHISHTWIVSDSAARFTTGALRDKAREFMPKGSALVVRVVPQGWSGTAPKEAFDWLRKYASKETWKDL